MWLYRTIQSLIIYCILFSGQSFCQDNISKYEEFALFVSGKQFPLSITDTTMNLDFWHEYQSKINEDWAEMDSTRLTPMNNWRKAEISSKINDSLLLFYPFSGPDFLHAYILFPNSGDYVFLAQEPLGEIPDLSTMKQQDIQDYLDKFYYSIRDIYQRSYFITGRMNTDLNNAKIKGVLPLMLFFMSRTDNQIQDVAYEKLSSKDSFASLPKVTGKFSEGECIKISFGSKGSNKVKTLRYFRCDISDDGMKNCDVLKGYLSNLGTINTYVKSASYLLHYETFTTIRNIILDNSHSVLQDDTGIPYKYYSSQSWTPYLYGVYVKPIDDFPNPYLFQKDLKEVYDSGNNIHLLPFSLGYHWRSSEQNQMLFIRK